jgi:uncharacterized membrane protein YbaN (DUF454 family)
MSEERKRSPVWRMVRLVLGVALIPLGIVGLFLPFLQGILFLVAALALLADEVPFLARFRDRIRERHPGPWLAAERFRAFVARKLGAEKESRDESGSL